MIEMLMATAITLIMMAAVVTLFANLSGGIRNRRAVIELSGQLRQVRQRLSRDLAGCTVPPGPGGLLPWQQRPGEAIGYFEVIEGNHSDKAPSRLIDGVDTPTSTPPNLELDYATTLVPGSQLASASPGQVSDGRALGDYDDVLAFTTRSVDGTPFVAQVGGNQVESTLAEVLWYADEAKPGDASGKEPGMRTIYRKVLLIAPWLASGPQLDNVSMHKELQPDGVSIRWVPNTLADLTRREFRYGHKYEPANVSIMYGYPHEFDAGSGFYDEKNAVLSDALAFDVRVFDPGAPLYETGGVIVDPGDPGWLPAVNDGATPINFGAYVDLGWNNDYNYKPVAAAPAPLFQFEHRAGWIAKLGPDPNPINPSPPNNPFRGGTSVYDTWTWHYENDGIDQDNSDGDNNVQTGADQGTNGRDDPMVAGQPNTAINGVDDILERETSPPYPVPLRAVRVILRTYERDARQIREVSVTNSFVP